MATADQGRNGGIRREGSPGGSVSGRRSAVVHDERHQDLDQLVHDWFLLSSAELVPRPRDQWGCDAEPAHQTDGGD